MKQRFDLRRFVTKGFYSSLRQKQSLHKRDILVEEDARSLLFDRDPTDTIRIIHLAKKIGDREVEDQLVMIQIFSRVC